jgi:hypothetical protein
VKLGSGMVWLVIGVDHLRRAGKARKLSSQTPTIS